MALTATPNIVLLADLLDEWCDREGIADSTRVRDRWAANLILDHFGQDRDARTITRGEVIEFKSILEATYAGSTPRAILYNLVRPMENAHLDGRLPTAVTVGLLLSRRS